MPATPPDTPPSPRRSGTLPLRVMLVVAQEPRREQVRGAVRRLVSDARFEIAGSGVDALLRSAQSLPADLLVLDLAVDGALGPALTRHLARKAQSTAVLVFGDQAEARSGTTSTVWSWNEVDLALQRWFDERQG